MRVGEAEREAAVDELRRHAAAGRLDVDELEERVSMALAARTEEDLAELRGDLPAEVRPDDGFREHLRVFLAVQLLLVAIWALTGAGYFWPVWPFLGWGVAVVLHRTCDPGRPGSWANASRSPRRTRATASS